MVFLQCQPVAILSCYSVDILMCRFKVAVNTSKKQFLVGIGAAKSGTSWLYSYLNSHPEVTMSPIKELHYFDSVYVKNLCGHWHGKWQNILQELAAKYAENPSVALLEKIRCVASRLEMADRPDAYRQYFNYLQSAETKAFGEVTPSYSLLPEKGFQAILDAYSDAKFVFIVRDPVDRALSQIQFLDKVAGRAPSPDLQPSRSVAELESFVSDPHFILRSDYQRTLTNLYRVVPRDRVLVLMYEHLFSRDKHERNIRRLCEFSEISYLPGDWQSRVNQSNKMLFSSELTSKFRAQLEPVYRYMLNGFPDDLPETWRY